MYRVRVCTCGLPSDTPGAVEEEEWRGGGGGIPAEVAFVRENDGDERETR